MTLCYRHRFLCWIELINCAFKWNWYRWPFCTGTVFHAELAELVKILRLCSRIILSRCPEINEDLEFFSLFWGGYFLLWLLMRYSSLMVNWRRSYCIDAECNLILMQTLMLYWRRCLYWFSRVCLFCSDDVLWCFAANVQVVLTQEMFVLYWRVSCSEVWSRRPCGCKQMRSRFDDAYVKLSWRICTYGIAADICYMVHWRRG